MVGRFLWGNFVCLDGSNRNLHQRLCDGFPETRNQKPGFPRASVVRNLPAVQETQETQVWSLGQEDPLDVGMATYFQYPCWENPMDRGAWWAMVLGVTKSQIWLNGLSTDDGNLMKIWTNIKYVPGTFPWSTVIRALYCAHCTMHTSSVMFPPVRLSSSSRWKTPFCRS